VTCLALCVAGTVDPVASPVAAISAVALAGVWVTVLTDKTTALLEYSMYGLRGLMRHVDK
jgi:hypothetical protein